jgi:hypothetical protein
MENVIIIGLPGSGKTYLMEQFVMHKKYDDFIPSLCDGNLLTDLALGHKVCICDPRLCDYDHFKRYITGSFNPSDTRLILFENDPRQCKTNCEIYKPGRGLDLFIDIYSNKYDLSNYTDYPHSVVQVYKN